jgi:hypothetical protein
MTMQATAIPQNQPTMPGNMSGILEIGCGLAVVSMGAFLVLVGAMGEGACMWLAGILLMLLVWLSWKRFDGGRHPCFLFMGMLLVFQGGRLVTAMAGVTKHPMDIVVATMQPIQVSPAAAEVTLLIVVLSGILVYAPCRLGYRPAIFRAGPEMRWLPGLYVLILVTFPFAFYKNWLYLEFIRSHGGYLSVYTDHAAILASAGVAIRSVALVSSTAMLVAYVFERKRGGVALLLALYFAVSLMDLLIGFRGKFFTEVVGLWYLHKLKTGKRFNLLALTLAVVAISLAAVAVAGFRQNQSIELLSPLGFLAQQGVSLNVTEAAVAFHSIFAHYGFRYLWGGFIYGIIRSPADIQHQMWSNDLTLYLNPIAEQMGFGTASAYVAELYLAGGLALVTVGSLAVGWALHGLHQASRRAWGAVLLAAVLPSVIYLPRLELLAPFAALVKAAVSLVAIAFFVGCFETVRGLVRRAADFHRRELPAAEE